MVGKAEKTAANASFDLVGTSLLYLAANSKLTERYYHKFLPFKNEHCDWT
jgi:hypothetical protein